MHRKKWIHQLALTTFTSLLCALTPTFSPALGFGNGQFRGPCDDPCSSREFEMGGEFIWWKPCLDHLEYGIIEGEQRVNYLAVCPRWEPGGRVWAYLPSFFCANYRVGASWTGICSKDSFSKSSDLSDGNTTLSTPLFGIDSQAIIPVIEFTQLDVRWKAQYQDYDVLFSYSCPCGSCSVFRPFFGFAGLIVNQRLSLEGDLSFFLESSLDQEETLALANIKWKSDLHAYGLRIGAEYECRLADCLCLFGKCAASVLTGKPDTKNFQRLTYLIGLDEQQLKASENECYRAYPGYHLTAGAVYSSCFCDVDFSVRIGYEFIEWDNLSHPRQFIDEDPIQGTGSTDRTFGWQGLLVGASMGF